MYKAQEYKDHALRSLLDDLRRHSKVPLDPGHVDYERDLTVVKTSADAAERLAAILNTPVAEDAPDPAFINDIGITVGPTTMAVWVALPAGVAGPYDETATLVRFDGSNTLDPSQLKPMQRVIIGAMLDHAREQLDA